MLDHLGVVFATCLVCGRRALAPSLHHIGLDESYKPAQPNSAWDYFHLNSVDVDQADGNLIISGRNTWAFYKVQRPSGKVLWRLGGKQTTFKLGAGAQFAFQHDVRRHADGTYTLFDNEGGPPAEAAQSRGVVLSVDEKSLRANLLRQYLHSPPVLSEALGSVQDMYGENRFIGWGESSYITEYGMSGQPIFDARLAPSRNSWCLPSSSAAFEPQATPSWQGLGLGTSQ